MGFGSGLAELLFPPRCPLCGRVTAEALPCERCLDELADLPFAEQAADLEGFEGEEPLCPIVAYPYEGVVRSAILRYKKLGCRDADKLLAAWLCVAVRRACQAESFDLVTAAPGSLENRRARGFDAGERIAQRASELLELPFVSLFEPHGGTAQKELTQSRRRHAANKLVLKENGPPLAGARILLIDDVITTGATMSACVNALKRAGAGEVTAAAVAAVRADPSKRSAVSHAERGAGSAEGNSL